MGVKEHLADIDFRRKEVRQANAVNEFVIWYEAMSNQISKQYSGRVQAQLEILSAVLWHLLPDKEYKRLTKLKGTPNIPYTAQKIL